MRLSKTIFLVYLLQIFLAILHHALMMVATASLPGREHRGQTRVLLAEYPDSLNNKNQIIWQRN